jgi:hypothetical protein
MAALKARILMRLWDVMKSPWFRRFIVKNVLLPLIVAQTEKISKKEQKQLDALLRKRRKANRGKVA